jgi:hypothetical protein
MSERSVVAAIPKAAAVGTIPTVAVPDVSGQAAYSTKVPPEIKAYFECEGEDPYINALMFVYFSIDGALGGLMKRFWKGFIFFWDNIFPDAWKAHGIRDYLYHDVAKTVLVGDPVYRKAKTKMLKENVPAWEAFPKTGYLGALEAAELVYWRVQSTWESVVASLRLPLDQLQHLQQGAALPYDLAFDNLWHNSLKKNHFFGYFPWEEKLDDGLRGITIDGRDESFKIIWGGWSGDPDQDEIEHFAAVVTQLVNNEMLRHLGEAAGDVLRLLASIKKIDDDFHANLLPYTSFEERFWQKDWRLCKRCGALFFGGSKKGVCQESNEGHDKKNSLEYALHHGDPKSSGQHNWRWCKNCQGLFYAGRKNNACPAGGDHDGSGSADYIMHTKHIGGQSTWNEEGWRWCKKCQGLYYASNKDIGQCPAGGAHDFSGSGHYVLRVVGRSDEEIASVH